MRLHLTLRARRDCTQDDPPNRGIMGRITDALDGTAYADHRDGRQSTFVFSDLVPPRPQYDKGDELALVIASPHDAYLSALASDFQTDPEFNVGEYPFEVVAGEGRDPDVGEPGSAGMLETLSGVYLPVTEFEGERFDATHEQVQKFRKWVGRTVQHRLDNDPGGPDPTEEPTDPFDDYRHRKTYAFPLQIAENFEGNAAATKWHLYYEVRDEHHRAVLNYLLDAGLGARTAYGFGCLAPAGTWAGLSEVVDG